MQTDRSFTGRKGVVQATFTLSQEANTSALSIQLTNSQACQRYGLSICEDYIHAQDTYFKDNIETVAELYEHLTAEFDRLIITEDGTLIFEIEVTIKKKLEKKQYHIQGEREKISGIERVNLKIQQIRREIIADSEKKEYRIAALEQRQNILEREKLNHQKQLQILKHQMKNMIQQMNSHNISDSQQAQEVLKMIKIELENNKEKIEISNKQTMIFIEKRKNQNEAWLRQIREEIERYGEGLATINRFVEYHQNQLRDLIRIPNIAEYKIRKMKMHPQNPQRDSFRVKDQSSMLTVCRVGENGIWQSFFGAVELEKGRGYSFKIKQVKSKFKHIMIGIGSRNAFGVKNGYYHKETLSYHSANGCVYELGSSHKGGCAASDGSVVSVSVNLNAFKVDWLIDGKWQATADICAEMRTSPLFFFMTMWNAGDQVQLLL